MTEIPVFAGPSRREKVAAWLLAGACLAVVVAANWHLVAVAVSSQPACVAHVSPGEGNAARGEFGAAESACAPRDPRANGRGP